jgi:hypothetical protein
MRISIKKLLEYADAPIPPSPASAPAEPPEPAPRARTRGPKNRPSAPGRHSRKCTICRHPDRALIEEDFVSWCSAAQISKDYGIPDRFSIYRHAHATGLFKKRARRISFALSPLIEQAQSVEVSARSIIRAVEVFAHLDEDGKWIQPGSNRNKTAIFPLSPGSARRDRLRPPFSRALRPNLIDNESE